MIFTKRSDYGLRAAMELAAGYGTGPLPARVVAHRGNLPEPFVRKLLQELARAGLASSQRGRNGGYRLSRAPRRITVRETLEAFETLAPVPCLEPPRASRCEETVTYPLQANGPAPSTAHDVGDDEACTLPIVERRCPTRAAWHLVDRRVRAALEEMTLDDLLREVDHQGLAPEMIHAAE
jgi:Rrf2 family protein